MSLFHYLGGVIVRLAEQAGRAPTGDWERDPFKRVRNSPSLSTADATAFAPVRRHGDEADSINAAETTCEDTTHTMPHTVEPL